ncbi:MAG: hypothetical protein M0Z77_09060 [Thermoplasmatales archaeon]|jgi:hypothetical protein|nr:hypothetical protein [Thermoplasmatales archaeon]
MIARRVDSGIPIGHGKSFQNQTLFHPPRGQYKVVVSASFKRDLERVKRDISLFHDLEAVVLSPTSASEDNMRDGFATLAGDPSVVPSITECRHLDAIAKSDLLWLIISEGSTGFSTSIEIGYAFAFKIPMFTVDTVREPILKDIVQKVNGPKDALLRLAYPRRDYVPTLLLDPRSSIDQIKADVVELESILNWEGGPMDVTNSYRSMQLTRKIESLLKVLGNLDLGRN